MVLVALAIRLGVMGFLYQEQTDPDRDHWRFAYEAGRVARSIATGHGYGSPLFADTGPTAWQPPIYPYIIAGVFQVFGVYSTTSAFVLLISNALISALTCIPIFFVARRIFGESSLGDRIAVWSGWAWAFFPYAIYFSVERIWGTWLATLLLTILLLLTLRFEKPTGLRAWAGYGLLWGFTALIDPVVLTVLPAMMGWVGFRLYQRRERWLAPLTVASLALVLSVSPWFIRNYEVFHRFIPFRDTMGLELMVGNYGDTFHWHPRQLGPWHNEAEWQQFQKIGEVAYMDEKKAQAVQFIRGHKAWFVWVTVRRLAYIWTGFWSLDPKYLAEEPLDPFNIFFCTAMSALALVGLVRLFRENRAVAILFTLILLFFPVIYYITHMEVYYRRQIDPLMVMLAVYAVVPRLRKLREKWVLLNSVGTH